MGVKPGISVHPMTGGIHLYQFRTNPMQTAKVICLKVFLSSWARREMFEAITFSRHILPGARPHANDAPAWGFRTRYGRSQTDLSKKSYSTQQNPVQESLWPYPSDFAFCF
jgi:hypothetical protein